MPLEAYFPLYSEALWPHNPIDGDEASRDVFPLTCCSLWSQNRLEGISGLQRRVSFHTL